MTVTERTELRELNIKYLKKLAESKRLEIKAGTSSKSASELNDELHRYERIINDAEESVILPSGTDEALITRKITLQNKIKAEERIQESYKATIKATAEANKKANNVTVNTNLNEIAHSINNLKIYKGATTLAAVGFTIAAGIGVISTIINPCAWGITVLSAHVLLDIASIIATKILDKKLIEKKTEQKTEKAKIIS